MEGLLFLGAKVTRGRGFGLTLFGREGFGGRIFLEARAARKRLIVRHGNRPFTVSQT